MGGGRNQRFRLANASLRLHKRRHAPQAFQTAITSAKNMPQNSQGKQALPATYREKIPFSERPGDVIGRCGREA